MMALVAACALGCGGCQRSDDTFWDPDAAERKAERAEVAKEIAQLKAGARLDDVSAEVTFFQTIDKLISRGPIIEDQLIEALGGSENWGVRYGVIFVIDGIGSKAVVGPLIERLRDPEPFVAFKALSTLRVLCGHQIIPEEGVVDGIPAIPEVELTGTDPDEREKPWRDWYAQNGEALYKAWKTWWTENRQGFELDG